MNDFNETAYTQTVFRTLLDCMARPGTIGHLHLHLKSTPGELSAPFTEYLLGVALTLMDQEVVFHVWNDRHQVAAQLQLHTMSRPGDLEDCDYLLAYGGEAFEIDRLKKGSWQFPDESATIICQVDRLAAPPIHQAETIRFELHGPGIQQAREISVSGLNPGVLEPWRQCNREFPLGLDWILVDRSGQVCCLPRSTRFSEEVL